MAKDGVIIVGAGVVGLTLAHGLKQVSCPTSTIKVET